MDRSSVLAREGAGCGSVGDVPGAWLASAPLSPPNAPGKAPNHIHTTLRWGRAPGKPSLAGESGLVSRGSQGLRSPLESRRGSLGAP